MSSKDRAIRKLYENIVKDKEIFNELKKALSQEAKFDKKFITKNLLPLAQKIDPEITCDDILEYENKRAGYSGLSEEDLENVAGGNAATAILGCGFLALMGFLGGMTNNTNTASAEFIPFSQTSEAKQLVRKEARDPSIKQLKRRIKADTEDLALMLINCQNKVISSQEKLIEYIENYNSEKFHENLSSLIEKTKNSKAEQFSEDLSELIKYIKNSQPEAVNENLSKVVEEFQTSHPENFNEISSKLIEEIQTSYPENFSKNLSNIIKSLRTQEITLKRVTTKPFSLEKLIKQHLVKDLEKSNLSNNNPNAFTRIKDAIDEFQIDEATFDKKYPEIPIDANDKAKIDEAQSEMINISNQLKENDPETSEKIEEQALKSHNSLEKAFKLINFIRSEEKSAKEKIAEVQTHAINEKINNTNLNPGSIPFYLQADHLVDGILWFKDSDTDKVFFILDRSVENGESKYTCPYYEKIMIYENMLFDIKDLPEILKESYKKAEEHIEPNDTSTLQIEHDNPLYTFARFYNSNYKFDEVSNRERLSGVPMYASSKNQNGNLFKTIDWDESIINSEIRLNYANQLLERLLEQSNSWEIAHRKQAVKGFAPPEIIESHKFKRSTHTYGKDSDILRNTGFVFFTLQPQSDERNVPSGIFSNGILHEFKMPFKNDIPLVSCSLDMLGNLETDDPNDLDTFPCFNGTSEEVKEQIIKYYVNEKVKDLEEKDCNENNISKHINEIIEQIKDDNLEVRIPAKVVADNWESFEYKEK